MIKSVKDLQEYISQDMKANGLGQTNKFKRWLNYKIKLLLYIESAIVCKYLRVLRRYEYFINANSNILNNSLEKYYKFRHSRLSIKYSIRIWPNCVESGLRIYHISGGGDYQCFTYG